MIDVIIISGASELIPDLRFRLSKLGLSVSCSNGIGNLTVAVREENNRGHIKKSDMQDMIHEIRAVLKKYGGDS